MTTERKTEVSGAVGKPVSVSKLIKPRYVRKPRVEPKYRLVQSETKLAGSGICGELIVKKPADLERSMKHWLDKWQHANPGITYSDIDPCKAHWSRLNIQS
ncbi:MAG: hypothetical protein KG075_09370 [Alphaproteobacteria bacterium]|nr:hypothetical protein [Alphaproteobacteria bacterium]